MRMNGKKGSIPLDMILVFIVFISILSMTVIIAYTVNDGIRTGLDSSDAGFNTSALNNTGDALKIFNTGIPFIFFSFFIVAIALAWYLRTTPIISFFMIIIISIIGYIAQGMSNAFYDFSRSSSMTSAANEFDYVIVLLDNFGIYILIVGIIIVLFYFAKPKSFNI